jgi:hypothetical protein
MPFHSARVTPSQDAGSREELSLNCAAEPSRDNTKWRYFCLTVSASLFGKNGNRTRHIEPNVPRKRHLRVLDEISARNDDTSVGFRDDQSIAFFRKIRIKRDVGAPGCKHAGHSRRKPRIGGQQDCNRAGQSFSFRPRDNGDPIDQNRQFGVSERYLCVLDCKSGTISPRNFVETINDRDFRREGRLQFEWLFEATVRVRGHR